MKVLSGLIVVCYIVFGYALLVMPPDSEIAGSIVASCIFVFVLLSPLCFIGLSLIVRAIYSGTNSVSRSQLAAGLVFIVNVILVMWGLSSVQVKKPLGFYNETKGAETKEATQELAEVYGWPHSRISCILTRCQ